MVLLKLVDLATEEAYWQCCSFDDKKGSVNREASFFSGTLGGLLQMT